MSERIYDHRIFVGAMEHWVGECGDTDLDRAWRITKGCEGPSNITHGKNKKDNCMNLVFSPAIGFQYWSYEQNCCTCCTNPRCH